MASKRRWVWDDETLFKKQVENAKLMTIFGGVDETFKDV